MECSVSGQLATFMGTAITKGDRIEMELVEYRGATGAADLFFEITRCED